MATPIENNLAEDDYGMSDPPLVDDSAFGEAQHDVDDDGSRSAEEGYLDSELEAAFRHDDERNDMLDDSDEDPLRGEAMVLAQFFNAKGDVSDYRSDSASDYGSNASDCRSRLGEEYAGHADGFLPIEDDDLKLLRDAVARGDLVAPIEEEDEKEATGEDEEREWNLPASVEGEYLAGINEAVEQSVKEEQVERQDGELDGQELRAAVKKFISRFNLSDASRKLLYNQRSEMQRELIKFDPSIEQAVDESGVDAAFESFARDTMEISRQLHEYPPEVSDFVAKWNLSDESAQLLETHSASVRKQIIDGFNPCESHGSIDHIFQKACRTAAMDSFCDQWKLDRISRDRFVSASYRAQDEIMRKFDPQDGAPDSVNKIFTVFANKVVTRFDRVRTPSRRRSSTVRRPKTVKERKKFVSKWKLDEFCRVIFAAMPDHKAEEVMRDFGPRCHNKSKSTQVVDANPIFVSFVKSRDPRTLAEVTRGVRDGTVFVDRRFRRGAHGSRDEKDRDSKRRIKDFCKMWKLNEDCYEALSRCSSLVQGQVMELFDPVDKYANRNKVFMNFLRSRKGENVVIPAFMKKFGLDKESEKLLRSLDSMTLTTVLRNFAPREKGRNQNPVFMSFTRGLQRKNSEMLKKSRDVERVINDFIKKFDLNYEAREQLRSYAPSSQLRLIQDFRPREPKHGVKRSASKIFISYAKSRDASLVKLQDAEYSGADRRKDTQHWHGIQSEMPSSKRPRERSRRGKSDLATHEKRRRVDDKAVRAEVPIPRNHRAPHLSQAPRQIHLPWSPSPSPRHKRSKREEATSSRDVKRPYGEERLDAKRRTDRLAPSIREDGEKRAKEHRASSVRRERSYRCNEHRVSRSARAERHTKERLGRPAQDGSRPSERTDKFHETGHPLFDTRAGEKLDKARAAFLQRWKLDSRADEYLSSKGPDIQYHVMDNYLPREFLTQDRLSPLFMNFVKGVSDNWVSIKQGVDRHGRKTSKNRSRSRSARGGWEKDNRSSTYHSRTFPEHGDHEGRSEIDPARQEAVSRYIRRLGMSKSSGKLMQSFSPRAQDMVMNYFDPKAHSDVNEAFLRFYHSRIRDAPPERTRRRARSSSNIPPPTRY